MQNIQQALADNSALKKGLIAAKQIMQELHTKNKESRAARERLSARIATLEASYKIAEAIPTKNVPPTHEPGAQGVPDKTVARSRYEDCVENLLSRQPDLTREIALEQCNSAGVKQASLPAAYKIANFHEGTYTPENERRVPRRQRNASGTSNWYHTTLDYRLDTETNKPESPIPPLRGAKVESEVPTWLKVQRYLFHEETA